MIKRPENSTNREEREEDGIISSKEMKTGELKKAVFGYVKSVAWRKGMIYLLMSVMYRRV